jgi:cell division protein FtsQ
VIGRVPAVSDSGQRYWRREANRRVRKKRLRRSVLRLGLRAILRLAAFVVLGYAFYGAVVSLLDSREFRLERIDVRGARRASAAAVRGRLAEQLGRSLFQLDLREVERLVLGDPWIERCAVKRLLPDTLRVELHERSPFARARIDGRLHVVDDSGYVIGAAETEGAGELPVLTGLEERQGAELAAALRQGVGLLDGLRRASRDFAGRIAEVDLSHGDRVTVTTAEAPTRLLLDPSRIERNLLGYLALREEIGRLGPADYVDLRWQDRIAVMPAPVSP